MGTIKKHKTLLFAALLTFCASLLLFSGCSSTQPTAFESHFFNVETNTRTAVVTVTNVVPVYQTNVIVSTLTLTNSIGIPVPDAQTNIILEIDY